MTIYIYSLSDPFSLEVRYVGKSCRPTQRLFDHVKDRSSCHRTHWIQQVIAHGGYPLQGILEELPDDADWQAAERWWIAHFREHGFPLTNGTSGGDGVPDLVPEARERIRSAWLGRKHRPETIEYFRVTRKGQRPTEAAPQDWMCEPAMLQATGLSVADHQRRTVDNLLALRSLAPDVPWIPVLQGWTENDYLRCWERYDRAGIDLMREPTVGLGTVCRRQHTGMLAAVVDALRDLRLHGFGVKTAGLVSCGLSFTSSDSMAWSYDARRHPALAGCSHRNCANCPQLALAWRERLLATLTRPRQLRFADQALMERV